MSPSSVNLLLVELASSEPSSPSACAPLSQPAPRYRAAAVSRQGPEAKSLTSEELTATLDTLLLEADRITHRNDRIDRESESNGVILEILK